MQHLAAQIAYQACLRMVSLLVYCAGCKGLHDLHLLRSMADLRDLDLSQSDVSDSASFA